MAGGSRDLTVRILGDSSGAEKALKQFAASVQATESKVEGFGAKMTNAGGKLTDFGRKATVFATLPIAAAMGYATKAASDLSETMSKSANVFGKSAAEVDKWSDTAAKSFGQSKRGALDAAATFGNLFVQLGITAEQAAKMSKAQTELASDFASFHNTSPEQAIEAMTAAYRGEFDAVQKFVPTINAANVEQKAMEMGLAATTKELDAQDKALATNALLTEGAGKAAGDFDRTSQGLANQTRILKAEFEDTAAKLGEKLIPVALKVAQVAGSMLSAFSNLPPQLQNLALIGAGAVAAIGPLATIGGNVAKAVGAATTAITFLATSAATAKVAMTGLGLSVAGIAVGFLAYRTAVDAMRNADDKFNKEAATTVNSMLLLEDATDKTTKSFKEQVASAYMHGTALHANADAAKGAAANAKIMKDELERGRDVLDKLSDSTGVSKERIVELANSMGINLGDMSEEARKKLAGAVAEIQRGVTPTEKLAEVQETLSSKTATAAEQFDAFKTAMDAALGSLISEEQAAISLQEKIAALGVSIEENGTKTGVTTEKQRNLTSSLIDVVSAVEGEVSALTESGKIATDAASQKQALIDRLENLKRQYPQLAGPIQGYIDKIREIPDSANTTVTADTRQAEAALANLRAQYDRLRNAPNVQGPSVFGPVGAAPPGRAHGGPVTAGKSYIVGEHRPELFVPDKDGWIFPSVTAASPKAVAASGTAPVVHVTYDLTINAGVGTDGAVLGGVLVEAIQSYERSNGPAWRSRF